MAEIDAVLDEVLAAWARDIREHRPQLIAARFTEDAVFQGFDPEHAVGRAAVTAYYDKQPVGLDPRYRVRELRPLGADAFAAFVDVDFVRPNDGVIPTHLTLVLTRAGGEWLIRQYHVSKIGA